MDPQGFNEISRLRASDADRDRAASVINNAMAEGRLTAEEHSDRLDAIYAAKTHADIVPLLDDQKMGLMVWSPLAGGLLSGKFGPGSNGPEGARRAAFDFPPVDKDRAWKCIDAMREVAGAHGVSVARVALAYVLAKPFVMSVIIGAKTMEQLDDNLEAVKLSLSAEEIKTLDDVSALPMEYPGWMVARQGSERRPQPK